MQRKYMQWIWLIAAAMVFGVLLSLREDFGFIGMRALIAASAFIVFGLAVSWYTRLNRQHS